jgi:SAM-dependent methyltransferase
MTFISMRRFYLDSSLEKHKDLFHGRVLDIGGKKTNRRGSFTPPSKNIKEWTFLNNDPETRPDILTNAPPIPCEDNFYDVVLLSETLEYIYDAPLLLQEIHRILKPNGTLIMSVPFLHLLHNDHKSDYYRFTESYIKRCLHNFSLIEYERQGGLIAVLYDLVRGYFSYSKTNLLWPLKIWRRLSPLFLWADQRLFKNRFHINTGFFIIGEKQAS